MPHTATSCENAAENLIRHGYAVLKWHESPIPALQKIFADGRDFFGLGDERKFAASSPSRLEGYRPLGAEFSEIPQRPDLCEYFTVWPWNAAVPEIRVWAQCSEFHGSMSSVLPRFAAIADAILECLRQRVNPEGQCIQTFEASYLQMNHYRPADFDRDFLQDCHEDGHILTILKSTAPGLEIRTTSGFTAIDIEQDELLVFPGSILTLVTGGLIPPLFHRVRNDRTTMTRQSLLYFVNPSLSQETRPWIQNQSNFSTSIRTIARSCIGGR